MQTVLSWITARVSEPSTWAGIAAGAAAIASALNSHTSLAAALAAGVAAVVIGEKSSS